MVIIKKNKVLIIIGILLILSLYFITDTDNIDGESIYKMQGCATCHLFKGQGGGTGPDLTNSAKIRSDKWLRQQIKNPAKNNPNTRMPAYKHLSRKEINALIKYLKS